MASENRSFLVGSWLVVLGLLAAGCGGVLRVRAASPHPNVMLSASSSPSQLQLSPAIENDFIIPRGSIAATQVLGWRETLEEGFGNAFPGGGGPTLELLSAELSFAPDALRAQGGVGAVHAIVRYRARVLDAAGNELAAHAGEVRARDSITDNRVMSGNAANAVEAMYEELAGIVGEVAASTTTGASVEAGVEAAPSEDASSM